MKFLSFAALAATVSAQVDFVEPVTDVIELPEEPESVEDPIPDGCDARSMISQHEGKRKCVYTDTMGHPTIGIGFNLDASGAQQAIEKLGLNYDDVRSGAQCLTESQIMDLFEPSY